METKINKFFLIIAIFFFVFLFWYLNYHSEKKANFSERTIPEKTVEKEDKNEKSFKSIKLEKPPFLK